MIPSVDTMIQVVCDVSAEEILSRFGTLQEHQIHNKDHMNDLVTDADIYSEQALGQRLMALLPGSVIIGEESCYQDRTILRFLLEKAPVWILDPVDGTSNFSYGREQFGVIVALIYGGCTIFGCLHDPIHNITISGEKGSGTWLGSTRLMVPEVHSTAAMSGSISGISRNTYIDIEETSTVRLVRYASVAHDYFALLLGQIHFSLYNKRLLPWDHAAGVLLHREAGGYSALIEGFQYHPICNNDSGLLLAPDYPIWEYICSNTLRR